jgi:hypothetical protein
MKILVIALLLLAVSGSVFAQSTATINVPA